MTDEQFQQLLKNSGFLTRESVNLLAPPDAIETHISYVILTEQWVYKIKKTLLLPFLDFTTVAQRRHYCEEELRLNQRLAPQMYHAVLPIKQHHDQYLIGEGEGVTIDYALKMKRMDNALEMDKMLMMKKVQKLHIISLAQKVAEFHGSAKVTRPNYSVSYFQELFNPIGGLSDNLVQHVGIDYRAIVEQAIAASDYFLDNHIDLLRQRCENGLVRDVHGDLHSKNIFLTTPPTIFDCIEFDASLRQIDLLNEVAFLSKDLDFWQQASQSQLFYQTYSDYAQSFNITDIKHSQLFIYYKLYRANVRAKVLSMQAQESAWSPQLQEEIKRYLLLMKHYISLL